MVASFKLLHSNPEEWPLVLGAWGSGSGILRGADQHVVHEERVVGAARDHLTLLEAQKTTRSIRILQNIMASGFPRVLNL